MMKNIPLTAALSAAALALGGCGGGDDAAAPAAAAPAAPVVAPTVVLSGVAAVGTPIAGAALSARCAGATSVPGTSTNASGAWTLSLAPSALPCALEVSGGSVGGVANAQKLYSYAQAAGVTNITTLTDLTIGLAAGRDPAAWFAALDASHPPALGSALATAQTLVVQTLTGAHYTLPGGSAFDPLHAPFNAATGDAYDGLLDAFASSLQASGKSYTQLLTDVLAAASGGRGLSLPAFGVTVPADPQPGTSTGPIVLAAKGNLQPADVAPLVGSYSGSFGSTTATGAAAVPSSTCNIGVAADGSFTLTIGGKAFVSHVSGDVGDLVLKIGDIDKAIAFDFSTNTNISVEVVRGYVVGATATDNSGAGSCTRLNPHATSAGSSSVQRVNGATAADFDAALAGSYGNGSCSVSLSSAGLLHLVQGSVDVQASLGGDEQDVVIVLPSIGAVSMEAQDAAADGQTVTLSFTREAADASLNLPVRYSADARITAPRPVRTLASCQNLVKQ